MKHLSRFPILILAICFTGFLHAQVQVTLTIPSLGSPYLSDYISNESNRVLILTNTTGQQQAIFLRGKIEQLSSPGYYFRTKEGFRPLIPIVLAPFETRTLFASSEDWAFMATGQLEDNVPSAEKRRIQATGILPEGEYQICIQAFDFDTEAPLSPAEPAGCQFFMVSLGSPPQLIQPMCEDTVSQEYPLISWTPAIIMQSMPDIVYDLYVVELTSRALNPQEVMEQSIQYRGGNPFVVENLRQTFYQFLPGDPPMNPNSRYAVCVVARTGQGSGHFENDGRSEICLFYTKARREISAGPISSGPQLIATEMHADDFQMHPLSSLQGRLLYRFHGDGIGIAMQQVMTEGVQLMNLQPGQALQNQGYQGGGAGGGIGAGGQVVMGNYGSMGAAVFDNTMYQQPPPPQWILPAGYNINGGKPLKQARIKFTARYAVGNTANIQHPEDLTLIPGMGYPIRVTGSLLPEQLTFPQATKVVAATTTDNDGNYDVTFFADDTYGMITGAPVDVQWGGGEFPAGVSGYGFYRVITMEVEERWYCHPDIVIFLQPGQSLDVPTQCVTVQSYDVRFTLIGTDHPNQQAGTGGPIRDAVVKVGRAEYLYDQFPACFPKDEIKIGEFGHLMIGSPVQNVMTGDTGMTDATGNITFRRLVKHDGWGGCNELVTAWPTDVYYVEARSHPTIGDLNYHIERKKQFAPCGARLSSFCNANDCAPRSANYTPPLVEYEMQLLPLFPKIVAYTEGVYDGNPQPLPDVNLIMLVYHENGDFRLKPYKTDGYGHFIKQFTTGDMTDFLRLKTPGQITSRYVMDYFKSGYKRLSCNDCATLDNKKILKYGQKWDLDILLEPKGRVKAIVEDEHGQPIYGDVKIGDGPYLPFGPKATLSTDPGGIDPGLAYEMPDNLEISPQGQLQIQGQGQYQVQQQGAIFPTQGGNVGQVEVQQGGMQVEYEVGNYTLGNWEMVSWFEYPAQTGQNIPVIIRPDATNYFADTFYVDIPSNYDGPYYDLGTFVIKEKLHRPRIVVYQNVFQINPQTLQAQTVQVPLEGAEVILSNLPHKTTGADGAVSWVFGSPANEFRLRINKQGYIPYDQFITIPPSKDPYLIEVVLEHGKVITGTVTRADGGQPIEDARIYTEIGSNNYGPIVIETFTNQDGNYTLDGLPTDILEIQATKADPDITYIGQTKSVNTATTTQVNFQLQEAPFNLSHIWNLPVAIASVTPSGNNWKVTGAFVDLPHNARFAPEDETQRLDFTNITVQVAGPPGPNGKPPVEPTTNSVLTDALRFRSILNDAHIVEMSGPKASGGLIFIYDPQYIPVSINKIRVDKGSGSNGLVKTRVFSLLEYFRLTYNYNGQFYLGETPDNILVSSYKGTADLSMPETYHLMGYDYFLNQPVNPHFVVHNFPAFTDRHESYVHQDSFVLAAKLIVDLPLSNPDKITVSTGDIIILPDKVHVNQGDEPLEFDLETWHVETGVWEFDPNQGGIVTSGVIQTNLLEFYAPNIVIKPTSLKLPSSTQINLNSLSLGGVLDLDIVPNAQLIFDYQPSPSHDPAHGHWRIVLAHPQTGESVASVGDLPGWPTGTEIDIYFIKNFSDGYEELTMSPNQVVNHYNMIEQTVSNIYLYDNGVALSGNTNLGIPNCPNGSSAAFVYSLNQGQIDLTIQGLYTTFETNGQVEFLGDQHPERIFLTWDHFEVTGNIKIYDDLTADIIPLRGKIIKKPGDIRMQIIKVDGGGQLEGSNDQIIVLGGGQNGHKKVLQGEQLVANGAWEDLIYQAKFIGFGGGFQDGGDIMWFRVTGSLINDPTQADEVELANIETPFGDFSLTLVFSEMAIVGNLNVSNISMGAVTIIEGAINMRMGGLGFYLAAHLRALYPVIAELNTNFIVGSYPHVAPDAQEILKKGMYIQPLPDFLLQTGIQGLYICANKPMFEVDWEIDLLVFGIGIWAEAGIDARFWLNFGSQYGAAHLGGLGYAAFELYVNVLGVCDLCVGLLAELGFEATYQWEPTTSFDISACGTIGFSVDFCGTGFNETAKLEVGWSSSSNDVYYDAVLGESCSGNAEQGGGGCSHF